MKQVLALQERRQALINVVESRGIRELSAFSRPPSGVAEVMNATMLLAGIDAARYSRSIGRLTTAAHLQDWRRAKVCLNHLSLAQLHDVDAASLARDGYARNSPSTVAHGSYTERLRLCVCGDRAPSPFLPSRAAVPIP